MSEGPIPLTSAIPRPMVRYRLSYTLRVNGLEWSSCHYCQGTGELNHTLRLLEERGAWGFSIAELS